MGSESGYASEERLTNTLEELFDTTSLKWIFVGGKGGVGKTTTSCAVALELAKRRESVLILSTDPAHNLSDAFSQKFSSSPALVEGFTNLYAMEIDPTRRESNEFTLGGDEKEKDGDFLKFIPELLSAFPGIDEALSFAELMNSVRTMNYSVIVFDTAPTGHTLRLIGFPDILEKGLSKLVSFREKMSGALSMVTSMTGNALNEEELHHKLDSIRALTASVRALFQDPTRTTFVCVCIPEFLSVYETERLVQELSKHRIDVSNIVVNQVLFPIEEADQIVLDAEALGVAESGVRPATTPYEQQLQSALKSALLKIAFLEKNFASRRRMQSKYLQQIDDLYSADFHVVPMPLQPKEVRGVELIRGFSELLKSTRALPILACSSTAADSIF